MTKRTIDNVVDEIAEWQGQYGFMYTVTAFTTEREVISATKKDRESAAELQELLIQAIGQEQEFRLEDNGKSKNAGVQKWNLVAFGPPEGVWTYSTIKGGTPEVGADRSLDGSRALGGEGTPTAAPTNNVEASIRAQSAARTAATAAVALGITSVAELIQAAEAIGWWVDEKSSGVTPQGSPEVTGEGAGGPVSTEGEAGEAPAPSSDTHWQDRVKDWPDTN